MISCQKCDDTTLLSESLQRKLNLEQDEVELILSEFVKKIKNRLNKHHYCRLDGIGYLFSDSKGALLLKDTFWKSVPQRSCSLDVDFAG